MEKTKEEAPKMEKKDETPKMEKKEEKKDEAPKEGKGETSVYLARDGGQPIKVRTYTEAMEDENGTHFEKATQYAKKIGGTVK